MSDPGKSPAPRGRSALNEVRYSLREMLVEVAGERSSGAMGAEKLQGKAIRKLFPRQPRQARGRQD